MEQYDELNVNKASYDLLCRYCAKIDLVMDLHYRGIFNFLNFISFETAESNQNRINGLE